MSTPKAPPTKPTRKEREREKKDKERLSQPPTTERVKTVVRRLPPNLPEDVFWQSVQAWVSDETVTWKVFYPGKLRKRLNKENIPSRAYIAFKTEEQLAQFSREYDGHLFRDKAEFAPYQKVPPEKKKADARSDEDYISFLASLNAENSAEPASLESLMAANQPPPAPKTTPLLEALKAEKAAQKEKESAIRQIAQQKRDEAKKKNANAAVASTASTSGAPLSKKAAKRAAAAAAASSASTQGQAPKPGVASGSKPGPSKPGPAPPPTPNGTTAAPPRPPKPPKAPRPQGIPGPPAVPTDVSVASAANTGITNEPPAAAPRRTRPVIGLASRQFEAALSGAGVAGGPERKSRRERERERAAAAASAEGEGAPTGSGSGAANGAPTPRKEKPARRKDSVSGGVAVSTPGGEVRVPSILQRASDPVVAPLVVHRIDGDVPVQPQAGVIPVTFTANGVPRGAGGGRRPPRGGPGGARGRGGTVGGGVPQEQLTPIFFHLFFTIMSFATLPSVAPVPPPHSPPIATTKSLSVKVLLILSSLSCAALARALAFPTKYLPKYLGVDLFVLYVTLFTAHWTQTANEMQTTQWLIIFIYVYSMLCLTLPLSVIDLRVLLTPNQVSAGTDWTVAMTALPVEGVPRLIPLLLLANAAFLFAVSVSNDITQLGFVGVMAMSDVRSWYRTRTTTTTSVTKESKTLLLTKSRDAV
ncbi:Smg-4/UPF3 family-domain-containing protein [Mycena polygramma]|nr:Smg-4/UPF3 family-domain-containing protein [Mycena polygramma]